LDFYWRWEATHGPIVADTANDTTIMVKTIATATRHTTDIIMDGIRGKSIYTGTATSTARVIVTGIGIAIGLVIAVTAGTIIGIAITKGAITASESWKSTSIITIPNVIVTMMIAPASLSW
jgi:hypothetical protein